MSRPPLPPDQRLDSRIEVRATVAEVAAIREAATYECGTVAGWVRQVLRTAARRALARKSNERRQTLAESNAEPGAVSRASG
jgi:hypothetical protein